MYGIIYTVKKTTQQQREVINMFFKSISGTCYYVTNVVKAERYANLKGYEEITSAEFFAWCEKRGYKAEEFTIA